MSTKDDTSACVLVLYLGPLPPWFPSWLRSSRCNSSIQWILIGDHFPQETGYTNVTTLPYTFPEIQTKFKSVLGKDIRIDHPYKICDFRPAFGLIFEDLVSDYKFWGHCDIDTIWGRIDAFITDEMWETYDKILPQGHLTFYRNVKEVNNAFLLDGSKMNAKDVFRSPRSCVFDESQGINTILKANGFKIMEEEPFADMTPVTPEFVLHKKPNYTKQAFFYQDGQVLQYYVDNSQILHKEFAYMHFQKRQLKYEINKHENSFVVSPKGFFPIPSELNEDIIEKFNQPIWHEKIGDIIYRNRYSYWNSRLKYKRKLQNLFN